MKNAVQLLMNHSVAVLFVTVLAEQAGLPTPAVPLLLAVGSLAGPRDIMTAIAVAMAACFVADLFWYQVGRRGRPNLLREPAETLQGSESFMRRRIIAAFTRHGDGVLLMAKFIPGPNLASPLAGLSGITPIRFLVVDTLGSILWSGCFLTLGYCLGQRIHPCSLHI